MSPSSCPERERTPGWLASLTVLVLNSGTPTSTTTSLSALSTTATKDGHRGALHYRSHQHTSSANSLEAERADRISRLTGMSGVSTLRGPPAGLAQYSTNLAQTNLTSTGLPANPVTAAAAAGLTPAYFDAAGQPVAVTKMSTVGTASATDSVSGSIDERTTTTTEVGGDQFTLGEERDEDMLNEMDSISASGYAVADPMEEDLDNLASQSVSGFDDHMSDDGSSSLVGFGEGAGSTLSGPIYNRRPLPTQPGATGATTGPIALWGLERSDSGLSEGGPVSSPNPHHSGASGRRDFATRPAEREPSSDTPVSQSAMRERGEARMMDGVALDHTGPGATATVVADDDVFVDTTTRGPVPIQPTTASTIRDNQHPYPRRRLQHPVQGQHFTSSPFPESPQPTTHYHHHHATRAQHPLASSPRETPEHLVREVLDDGENRVGPAALASPRRTERLERFSYEDC